MTTTKKRLEEFVEFLQDQERGYQATYGYFSIEEKFLRLAREAAEMFIIEFQNMEVEHENQQSKTWDPVAGGYRANSRPTGQRRRRSLRIGDMVEVDAKYTVPHLDTKQGRIIEIDADETGGLPYRVEFNDGSERTAWFRDDELILL